MDKVAMLQEESRILSEIEAKKEELIELQRRQNEIFSKVEKQMNTALESEFSQY